MTAPNPLPGPRPGASLWLLVSLAFAGPASGQEPATANGPVPSDPAFVATLVDGSTVAGRVRKLGEAEGLALVDARGETRTVPVDRLVKLVRDGSPPSPPADGGDLVLFPDGDRLARCKVGTAGDFNLAVRSIALDELAIPLDSILGVLFDAPTDAPSLDSLVARVRTEPRDSERLWLANGDKVAGLFAGLDDQKVAFQAGAARVELPRTGNSRVLALGFAPGQVSYRRPEGPFLVLSLVDGSQLGVTGARLERGQVAARTRSNVPVKVPIGELAQVHVLNSSVVYLSDREATATIYEPYVGPVRPYRRDSTVAGGPIRLGGRSFDRGLGTESRTVLVYKLEPGVKRFQATVGLDDGAGPLGSVAFKVRVDDKIVYESPAMSSGEPPRPLDVDLAGARFLILMTEFGERGGVRDLADWAEARLIR